MQSIRQGSGWRAALAGVAGLFVLAGACQAGPRFDLTGTWSRPDGATFSVRQVGNEVFWLGTSKDGGRTWTHVFHGTIDEDQLRGTYADLPVGRLRNKVNATFNLIMEDGRVVRISHSRERKWIMTRTAE